MDPHTVPTYIALGIDAVNEVITILGLTREGYDVAIKNARQRVDEKDPENTVEIEAFIIAGPGNARFPQQIHDWLTRHKVIGDRRKAAMRSIAAAIETMVKSANVKRRKYRGR